jgi:hypothetical protein
MKKILRKRISTWSLLSVVAAIGFVAVFFLSLTKPLPEYLVARSNLAPGSWVSANQFDAQPLDLGTTGDSYITSSALEEGLYLMEFVAKGELITRRTVSAARPEGKTTVVLVPSLAISPSITPGSWVQVWRTTDSPGGFMSERVVERCQVVSIREDESLVSDVGSQVEIAITEQESALILEAISAEQHLYLLMTT